MPTKTIALERIANALGAVVSGVDLREHLDDVVVEFIADALVEHQVLFFRDQDLDDEQQRAFASRFGTLGVFPVARLMGSTRDMSYIEDTVDNPPDADGWHTDITWIAEPPKIAILNARVIPEYGGDTLWASLFAAYDALSPAMQELCCGLRVRHRTGDEFLERVSRGREEIVEVIMREYPPVEHPLVRTHPVSGRRALFVAGGFMDQIVGMHRDESDMLLGFLSRHIENPNFQVRWHWREHDVAMWDEASTNHRALSDHYPQHRMMRRCTIDGDRPFFVAD
jgi:taurine dioxygenase